MHFLSRLAPVHVGKAPAGRTIQEDGGLLHCDDEDDDDAQHQHGATKAKAFDAAEATTAQLHGKRQRRSQGLVNDGVW